MPPACPIAAADGVAGRAFGLGTETVSELMGSLSGRTQLLARALARLGDRDPDEPRAPPPEYAPDPLVWREEGGTWRTAFPPPPGFVGQEQCDYGDEDYARTLTPDEQDIAEAFELRHPARVAHAAERDAWFAGAGDPGAVVDEDKDEAELPTPLDRHPGESRDLPSVEGDQAANTLPTTHPSTKGDPSLRRDDASGSNTAGTDPNVQSAPHPEQQHPPPAPTRH